MVMALSSPDDSLVFSLVTFSTPDPFVLRAPNGKYYMTFTCGDRVDLLVADSLAAFRSSPRRVTIWTPERGTPWSADLWAPELHPLHGRWYVYVAADDPRVGNFSHRMYVLGGPPVQYDPADGPWELLGPIDGMPRDQWAIDATVFALHGDLYLAYSGWPLGVTDSDLTQHLFILRLASPTRAATRPTCISAPTHPWEFTRDANGLHGINEGPQFVRSPDAAWAGLVFSCAASWTRDYKMGVLAYAGAGDPLDARSWAKAATPLLQSAPVRPTGPWGPGHGNFVNLGPDSLAVFHATDGPRDGWANRRARVQRVVWTPNGPSMGGSLGRLTDDLHAFTKFAPPAEAPIGHGGSDFHRLFMGDA